MITQSQKENFFAGSNKERILVLLRKNVPLRKTTSLDHTSEKSAVYLYKRAIQPLGVSKTRSALIAQVKRARIRRRLVQKSRRLRIQKLGLKHKVSPYTTSGRYILQGKLSDSVFKTSKTPDDFFKIVSLASYFRTTLGPGQHSRQYLSSTVSSQITGLNNLRFFYDFNEAIPGVQPLTRIMGVFIRKGLRQRAHKMMKTTVAKFKANCRNKVNHPYFFGKGLFRAARITTLAPALYLLQSALHKIRPPFRFVSYKVAASRKKIPVLNNISKSYSLVFNYIKNHLPNSMTLYKKLQKPSRPYNISSFYPSSLGRNFAEALFRKGRLADVYSLNLLDAKDNMANMRFGSFKKKGKRKRFK